jgi:hypothetical protein
MCFACDTTAGMAISPSLAARARRIEAGLPGRRVAEDAWRVLAGELDGTIPHAEMRRIWDCLDRAAQSLCAQLKCEAV